MPDGAPLGADAPGVADVVVVGAGTAGCVLAASLSTDPRRRVVLVDAGPAGADDALRGLDYLAGAPPSRFWEHGLVERVAGQPARPYRSGRGIGGSAAVNGMVAVPPAPDDFASWQEASCPSWSWKAVAPSVARMAGGWVATPSASFGSLERALGAASEWAGIGTFAPLALERAGDRRASVAERLLAPALGRANLTVLAETTVRRVLFDGRRTIGVELSPSSVEGLSRSDDVRSPNVERRTRFGPATIGAPEVVVAAGAIRSPLLLAASGLGDVLAGGRLSDHPSGTLTLHLRDGVPTSTFQTCGALRWRTASGAIAELVPIANVGDGLAALTLAIMDPISTGPILPPVRGSDVAGSEVTVARLGLLGVERDRVAMREALGDTLRLLAAPAFTALAERVTAGSLGFAAADLGDASDAVLDAWVAETGPLLHAGCSLPMGSVLDEHGRVPGVVGLRVVDASALPVLPSVAPNGTISVLAAHIAATWPPPA